MGDDRLPDHRRPYGFDWEEWGRWDAMEVLAFAKARYRPDQLTPEEGARVEHRSALNRLHKYALRKPFHFFKRMIYPKGSNEIVRSKFRKRPEGD